MHHLLRVPLVVFVLALTAGLTPAAAAAVPVPAPPAPAAVPGPLPPGAPAAAVSPSPAPNPSLTTSSVELNAQVQQQKKLLGEQEHRLSGASKEAAKALEAHQVAQRQAEEAARVAAAEAAALAAAQEATERAREQLQSYVGDLYRTGMGNRKLSLYSKVLDSRSPQQLFSGLGLAGRVGGNQGNALVALADAEAVQEAAAARAATAAEAQRSAEAVAVATKTAADSVVGYLKEQVADRQLALVRTQAAAAAAEAYEQEQARLAAEAARLARERIERLLAQAEAIARQRAEAPDPAIDGALIPRPFAACKGRDTRGYANGTIPADALCPLWGTRGQILRADAAAAFNDMSRAYAKEFGAPICVTDSYRSYDEQVAVAAAKPDLAARPGTSNHGWGVAVDLCDGIQDYDTDTHRWMADNSMLFGWFLPAWAQRDGSKPEPWHWEFAG